MANALTHLHCGDSSAGSLRASSLGGEQLVWCDILHEGPLPDLPFNSEGWLSARAAFLSLSTGGVLSEASCRKRFEQWNAALEAALASDSELVLWFDACLYDQCILARHLKRLSLLESLPAGGVSLVCAGSFPGFERFLGLGQLSPEQLASLFPSRTPVAESLIDTGAKVWDALVSSSHERLFGLALALKGELPFLGNALLRYLRQYPSPSNGLPLLDEEILLALAESGGPLSPGKLFGKVSDMEDAPYFGDNLLWRHVNALAFCEEPLLALEGPGPLPLWSLGECDLSKWSVSLLPAGREVLSGFKDNVRLNGVELSLGGVRLSGRECLRFDPGAGAFVWK